ncbi:putative pyruvate dehydrogenase protein X component [Paramyrothecium foliicola]|nr:putative pyruvate dehydrogenase protein X component [Paramyrothecium foliicola]
MPALSPTMTEGNIATWKVKEGDSYSAGDVLLEIETDKATMDVEAQDDGIMVKIMTQDGSKAVQVGTRIAVVAEAGDDISSLEIPADEQPKQPAAAPKQESAAQPEQQSQPEKKREAAPNTSDKTFEQRYPLLPSVGHLVKQHGLGKEDVNKIKPTGPGGRLLKGDVLAYVGSIKSETPGIVSARFDKLSHLDLSNISVAPKKEAPKEAPASKESAKAPVKETLELKVPISMGKVLEVQKKIQSTLGVFLPISTFISRAADVANSELPLPARAPTANELFDQVLGLDKLKATSSQGFYLPQIAAIPPASLLAPQRSSPKKKDIIDILAAPSKKPARQQGIPTIPGLSSGANVFSLVVPKAEEARAKAFLERCKLILEEEPGRLVL